MKVLILALTIILAFVAIGCSGATQTGAQLSAVPSGQDWNESKAYLQDGVNKYKEAFGAYPTDVKELLDKKDGKGPFVAGIPKCPSGNVYVIVSTGEVIEAQPQQ